MISETRGASLTAGFSPAWWFSSVHHAPDAPLAPDRAPLVAAFHVIGRQHARLAGSLDSAVHPALIDGLGVDDDITIPERDLVVVLSCVVIQRPVHTLQQRDSERSGINRGQHPEPQVPEGTTKQRPARNW